MVKVFQAKYTLVFLPVFRIRIWIHLIHMFLDHKDPDPLVRGIQIRILLSLSKICKKKIDFYSFVTSFWLFILEKWCKSTFKKYYAEKLFKRISFLLASWRSMMKIEWSGSESGSGSISQRHVSADPDPHHNAMDPEHCFLLPINPVVVCYKNHTFTLTLVNRVSLTLTPVYYLVHL